MTTQDSAKNVNKEAMKKLREERKEKIAAASAKMKEQKKIIKAIKDALKDGGKTVPQVAEQVGMSSSEVFWYIAALKKYGDIIEGDKDGAYFQYKLADSAAQESSDG